MLRILCFHGYAQNATIFRKRTGALRKALAGIAEPVFLNAPHVVNVEGSDVEEKDEPRCWWKASDDGSVYEGFTTSLDLVKSCVESGKRFMRDQGPFDGLLGFSQGACFAGLLPALLGDQSPKFVILVGGFKSRAAAHQDILSPAPMQPKLSVPSLHIIGATDEWVTPDRSKELLFCYDEKTRSLLDHAGGHYIPSDSVSKKKILDWISQFLIVQNATPTE